MGKFINGVKWIVMAMWVTLISFGIGTAILFLGSATIVHTLISLLRRW